MSREHLTYEEFGAVGDGLTDDFSAIIATHEAANERGLPVKAREGAVYHLGLTPRTAIICTDTDWTGATFLVDHRDLSVIKEPVFRVEPSREPYPIEIPSLVRDQTRIEGLLLESDVLVQVWDEGRRHYIRRGGTANKGAPATDCFVLTKDGEIKNRVMWDFPTITRAVASPIDEKELVIRGGTIRAIANVGQQNENQVLESVSVYSTRNLQIRRSCVTVDGFTDEIVGEGETGLAYSGAVSVRGAAYVTVKNSRFMGRKYFYFHKNNQDVPLGSYAINCNSSAFVSLINIEQTNDIMDTTRWGLMATNFCKDLYLESCTISRFDAHQGVTNCTIKKSRLGWMCLNAIGYGDFIVEDCRTFGSSLVNLRQDYGCLWNGSFKIKNCVWIPRIGGTTIFNANNDGMHDFGYPTTMPHTIEIDGLMIEDEEATDAKTPYFVLPDFDRSRTNGSVSPYAPTRRLRFSSIVSRSGRPTLPSAAPELYPDLEVN